MSAASWFDAMIRQYGVQLLFTVARVVGLAVTVWLTVVATNWYRDRDEKRNIDAKARRVITAKTVSKNAWKRRALAAEALAGDRLAIIRAATASMNNAAIQLRGATT